MSDSSTPELNRTEDKVNYSTTKTIENNTEHPDLKTVLINVKNDTVTEENNQLPVPNVITGLPNKGGDTIIDILTEKQIEPIIEGRRRHYWVYFFERSQPNGAALDYDEGDRNDFVRIVFLLVSSMLLCTIAFTFMAYNIQAVQDFMLSPIGLILLLISMIGIVTLNYIFCCSDCARTMPCNYILLVLATCFFSYLCAFITARYAKEIVLGAAITTLVITLVCLGLAFTSIDFTKFLLIVLVAFLAMAIAGLFAFIMQIAFHVNMTTVRVIILIGSSVASSVMLIIEFQMILGGRSVEIGEDDYAYAAYMIYTSIIDLFLKMLQIFAYFQDE